MRGQKVKLLDFNNKKSEIARILCGRKVKFPDFNDKKVKLPEFCMVIKWNCRIYAQSKSEIATF